MAEERREKADKSRRPLDCRPFGKYGLTIVSFDADFGRTERGRKAPAQVLEEVLS
jgi:hypothetical protein